MRDLLARDSTTIGVPTYLGAFVTTAATAENALDQLGQIKADVVVCAVLVGKIPERWGLGGHFGAPI